jgi:hypothetical protein
MSEDLNCTAEIVHNMYIARRVKHVLLCSEGGGTSFLQTLLYIH